MFIHGYLLNNKICGYHSYEPGDQKDMDYGWELIRDASKMGVEDAKKFMEQWLVEYRKKEEARKKQEEARKERERASHSTNYSSPYRSPYTTTRNGEYVSPLGRTASEQREHDRKQKEYSDSRQRLKDQGKW